MKVAEYAGRLLELSHQQMHDEGPFYCWLSTPSRVVVGFAKAATEEEVIDAALAESNDDIPAGMAETLARMAKNYLKVRPYCGGMT
jgi:hypothetical protein